MCFAETEDYWIPIGLNQDLDEAMKQSVRESIDFLNEQLGIDRKVAYAYLSGATDYEVSQAVDKTKGIHALIQKRDFAKFIENKEKYEKTYDIDVYVNNKYNDFINTKILQQADSLLELNNTEFRNTMQEFRNGLVIFAYNDAKIWHKASEDTAGLRKFYERENVKHDINDPAQAMYFWDYRVKIIDIFINDSACLKPSKAIKMIKKLKNFLPKFKINYFLL